MMPERSTDFLIIGAGASGLTALHDLKKSGREALLLEAHHSPGGCAGYFSRGGLHFDAGATTLSGFDHDGPLKQFLHDHSLTHDFRKIDPGIVILNGEMKLRRYANTDLWIREQSAAFPELPLKDLWPRLHELNSLCWSLAPASADWPPKGISSLFRLVSQNIPRKLRLAPLLLKTFENQFLSSIKDPRYRQVLDELLLISTQSRAHDVPAMMGIMGLCYPEDTWYAMGGMKGFFTMLLAPVKEQVFCNQKVLSITADNNGYLVKTNKENFRAKNIVSTLPVWKTEELMGLKEFSVKENEGWGALTAYYKVKLKSDLESLYYQVHGKISHAGSGSVFMSFSAKDDVLRNREDYQTLTLSTHIHLRDYQLAISGGREKVRNLWEKEFSGLIQKNFKDNILDLQMVGLGDPDTFDHFAHRHSVGGLPHTLKRNFLSYPKHKTRWNQVYQIGDTTFPGQGIVGVLQGARNFVRSL